VLAFAIDPDVFGIFDLMLPVGGIEDVDNGDQRHFSGTPRVSSILISRSIISGTSCSLFSGELSIATCAN
jgi:hypothetical protein